MHSAEAHGAAIALLAAIALVAIARGRQRRCGIGRHKPWLVSDCREAERCLSSEPFAACTVLGLDVEFVRGSQCPAAMLQMSAGEMTACFQLTKFTGPPPPRLISLLSNPAILKCGVGVRDDLRRLERWAASSTLSAGTNPSLTAAGGIELVPLARRAGYAR
jgi:MYXO-CTERM domain-containing protein